MNKLQIFYQPHRTHPDFWDSVTLSFYDYDEAQGTYKSKIVCEIRGQTFKKKALCGDLPVLAEKLQKLDLTDHKMNKVAPGQSYYYIKYGDYAVTTGSPDDIADILETFNFAAALQMFNEHASAFSE